MCSVGLPVNFKYIAWTELCLFFVEQLVKLAADTDSKRRLKEQEHQIDQAGDHVDRPTHIIEEDQIHHQCGQTQTYSPRVLIGQTNLASGSVFNNSQHPYSLIFKKFWGQ